MEKSKVLLVDDDKTILRSFAADFRELQVEAIAVDSGAKALRSLREEFFDVVITDLVMPEVDGLQVLREAKRNDSDTCVIVLTGYGDMESSIAALRLGADDYLLKPIDSEEMMLCVEAQLKMRRQRRKVKLRSHMLTVCSYCQKVRDESAAEDGHRWQMLERYLMVKAGVSISHGCCPGCFDAITSEWERESQKK